MRPQLTRRSFSPSTIRLYLPWIQAFNTTAKPFLRRWIAPPTICLYLLRIWAFNASCGTASFSGKVNPLCFCLGLVLSPSFAPSLCCTTRSLLIRAFNAAVELHCKQLMSPRNSHLQHGCHLTTVRRSATTPHSNSP